MRRQIIERTAAWGSLLVLALAWTMGGARVQEDDAARIGNISPEIVSVTPLGKDMFQGEKQPKRQGEPGAPVYIAQATRPGYGGPLGVAVTVGENKIIGQVAILHSTDTATYLDKVVGEGILDKFPGSRLDNLPNVDAVSGATLSSNAIIGGIHEAAARIGQARFGMPAPPPPVRASEKELVKLAAVLLLFASVLTLWNKRVRQVRKRARTGLMVVSTLVLGVWLGTQFSLSSLTLLMSGVWTRGVASYAALLCLVLAILVFLITRKNLYCATLCPFGAVQEGLGRITGCSPPPRHSWIVWTSRIFALIAISAALYFRNPADAVYEPFGMAFNLIGSDLLFALTILIVIGSLVVKRPWCRLFCPVTCFFDYLGFFRNGWARFRKRKTRAMKEVS